MVVLGSVAGLLFLIDILILVSNRNRGKIKMFFKRKEIFHFDLVQRWMTCMIVTIVTIIVEIALMLGVILCIAYCSGYISMISTGLDKGRFDYFFEKILSIIFLDVIASLLASLVTAISIIFYNAIIHLIGKIIH